MNYYVHKKVMARKKQNMFFSHAAGGLGRAVGVRSGHFFILSCPRYCLARLYQDSFVIKLSCLWSSQVCLRLRYPLSSVRNCWKHWNQLVYSYKPKSYRIGLLGFEKTSLYKIIQRLGDAICQQMLSFYRFLSFFPLWLP